MLRSTVIGPGILCIINAFLLLAFSAFLLTYHANLVRNGLTTFEFIREKTYVGSQIS